MSKTITLEEAQAVISAHRDAEYRARDEQAKVYVGRYFKYRNSYGGDSPKWWVYGVTTKTNGMGGYFGLTFQRSSRNMIDIRLDDVMWIGEGHAGWEEITATEFRRAAKQLLNDVTEALSPNISHRPPTRGKPS